MHALPWEGAVCWGLGVAAAVLLVEEASLGDCGDRASVGTRGPLRSLPPAGLPEDEPDLSLCVPATLTWGLCYL